MTYILKISSLDRQELGGYVYDLCTENCAEEEPLIDVLNRMSDDEHWSAAIHLAVSLMTREQRLRLAIWCAEQVLPIWEAKYPDDPLSRKAIEAAKAVLFDDSEENRKAADAASTAASASAADALAAADAAYAAYTSPDLKPIIIKEAVRILENAFSP